MQELDPPHIDQSWWNRLRPHLVAAFVTFHLACVILYVIPTPPYTDPRALNYPDVKEELDRFSPIIRKVLHFQGPEKELRREIMDRVIAVTRACNELRAILGYYLEPVGGTQSWNMFGGTPPRHPRVMVVEIRAKGEPGFVVYQDGHWGTPADYAQHFRHRKTQELLGVGSKKREMQWYARYWACRWDHEHLERPAEEVHIYFAVLNTLDAASVRAGKAKRAEKQVDHFTWTRPMGEPTCVEASGLPGTLLSPLKGARHE